ncbi:MAG: DUF4912 domain-containing protein [Planctomycetaceae bacterium]
MAEHAGRSKSELERLTRDELRELARGAGMAGFGSMRKSELLSALLATNSEPEPESQPLQSEATTAANGSISSAALFGSSSTKVALKNHRLATSDAAVTDSLDLTGLDNHWLQAEWSISPRTLERVVASMGVDWHLAKPTLRLYQLTCDEAGPKSKSLSADISLPVDARQWFIAAPIPGGVWQVALGYLSREGKFFTLVQSLPEELPTAIRQNNRAPAEETLSSRLRDNSDVPRQIQVELEVVLTIKGVATTGSSVTIDDDEVPVEQDGTFRLEIPLENGRAAYPIEVRNAGGRQRVLMAIERNTRFLETEQRVPDED